MHREKLTGGERAGNPNQDNGAGGSAGRRYKDRLATGALLPHLARSLKVSTDELLGLKPSSEKTPPKTARLRKRLQRVEELPAADQRTILKLVEALAEARRSAKPRPRVRAAS